MPDAATQRLKDMSEDDLIGDINTSQKSSQHWYVASQMELHRRLSEKQINALNHLSTSIVESTIVITSVINDLKRAVDKADQFSTIFNERVKEFNKASTFQGRAMIGLTAALVISGFLQVYVAWKNTDIVQNSASVSKQLQEKSVNELKSVESIIQKSSKSEAVDNQLKLKDGPKASPESLPSSSQPSLVPESNPSQNQQLPQSH